MIRVIQLRLVAESQADALTAIESLQSSIGSARVALSSPREGRKGQWLSYGTLQIAPENGAYAAERAAATGETTKLHKRSL